MPRIVIVFLISMLFTAPLYARIQVKDTEFSTTPTGRVGSYEGEWISTAFGEELPIDQEGVYHFRALLPYNSLVHPALYISPPNFPLEIYLNGDMIYKWSELSGRRMARYRAAVSLNASAGMGIIFDRGIYQLLSDL